MNLIERLRRQITVDGLPMPGTDVLHHEAADEIERLNKEIERLEKELSHWKYVAADYEISCTQQNVERLEGVRDAAIPIADNGYAEESDITRLREALDKEGT